MAYLDHFKVANVLDTFSWLGMPEHAQIKRLANLYLKDERTLINHHRNYKGPNTNTVTPFVKSLFQPPRGRLRPIVESVVAEIEKQRKIRSRREENPPFVWKRATLVDRREAVAAARFSIWTKFHSYKARKEAPNCCAVARVGDVLLIVSKGTYNVQPRIYMRHKPTGKVKVVVLEGEQVKSLTDALIRLSPKTALRGMFSGVPISLDLFEEGFWVGEQLFPWRNVCKVYNGPKSAHKTRGKPQVK
jgi:hypothetical protein